MEVRDDGVTRQHCPIPCLFCETHVLDMQSDRFVGLPVKGGLGDNLREKVMTIPQFTQEMFSKTDMKELRNGDINQRAAATKLEEMTYESLVGQASRFHEDNVRLVRICRSCWEGAEAGRKPPNWDRIPRWWKGKS